MVKTLSNEKIQKRLLPLILALGLLTRLPLPKHLFPDFVSNDDYSKSILYYPLIGLLIGASMALLAIGLTTVFTPFLTSALLLTFWVLITGALHLDGWADCSDAYYSAHKQPEGIFNILKDPHIGTMSVISLVLLLLVKFSLIYELVAKDTPLIAALLISPVMARLLAINYMLITPYVSPGGLAAPIAPHRVKAAIYALTLLILATLLLLTGPLITVLTSLALCAWLYFWRRRWVKIMGGYTGDCVGALIEGAEVMTLLLMVLL